MIRLSIVVFLLSSMSACGTFTGIPSHGGGKRFAIEQEVVAASARAAAKDVDVRALVGKRCALYIISMGDEGSGNLVGGRYEWQAAIRGEYVNTPTLRSNSVYPIIPTTTVTETAGIQTTTNAENAINAPASVRQDTEGADFRAGGGASYSGPGQYRAEAFINPLDAQFLRAVIHEAFMLRGVIVVPPDRAEVDVYVTVDIFGTHRRRIDMHVHNEERLMGKTAMQVTGFNRQRKVVQEPTTSSWEAEYIEKYIAWSGPVKIEKEVRRSNDLLVSFKDVTPTAVPVGDGQPPVPAPPATPATDGDRTRPRPPVTPLPTPDPSRPEDVK